MSKYDALRGKNKLAGYAEKKIRTAAFEMDFVTLQKSLRSEENRKAVTQDLLVCAASWATDHESENDMGPPALDQIKAALAYLIDEHQLGALAGLFGSEIEDRIVYRAALVSLVDAFVGVNSVKKSRTALIEVIREIDVNSFDGIRRDAFTIFMKEKLFALPPGTQPTAKGLQKALD